MAYPEHYLAVMGGTLRGDIWSCSIRMMASEVVTSSEQTAKAQAVFNAWKDTCSDPAVNIVSEHVVLTYGKFNRIKPDGTYQDPNNSHTYFGTPYNTLSASTFTNQDTCVLSWVTDFARGPASKGRIYVPVPSIPLTATTGTWSSSARIIAANFGAALINRLNNDPNNLLIADTDACVISPLGDGVANIIRSVRVGSVPDTQSRRRNALVEAYSVNTSPIV